MGRAAAAVLVLLAALLAGPSGARAEVLVSNFDQSATTDGPSLNANGMSQVFQTGNHAAGYSLTSIELAIDQDIPASEIGGLHASVWTADSSGIPLVKQFDLTNPASISGATLSDGKVTGNFAVFTAPANATLAASTPYALVATFSGQGRDVWVAATLAQTGAPGWSIFDKILGWEPEREIGRWAIWPASFLIRVNGAPRSASTSASLSALILANAADDASIALTPAFDSATTDYTADAGTAARVTVTPTTAEAGATVAYEDGSGNELADADGDSANGHQVDLSLAENVIRITVTTADGMASGLYRLTVTRNPAASVTGVAATSAAPRYREKDGTNPRDVYGAGDVIEFTVTFSAAVDVDTAGGVPALVFSMGTRLAKRGLQREAAYARGSGTTALVFAYTVRPSDFDDDGIHLLDATFAGGALRLNGGGLSAAGGGVVSTAIDAATRRELMGHMVDGDRSGPHVESLAVTSTPRLIRAGETVRDTYGAGETIEFTLVMSEAVTVTGTPHLQFLLSGNRNADYARGSGSNELVFAYSVQASDADADGLFVQDGQDVTGSDSAVVVESGERIAAVDDSADADLVNPGRGTKSGHKVDGSMTAPNSSATGAPEITRTPEVGQTLTAGIGTIADADGLPATFPDDYTFQWIRVDGSDETDISGETSQTYDPVAADVGKTLKVKVSFTDDAGNAETLTSEATAAVTAADVTPPPRSPNAVWSATVTAGENSSGHTVGYSAAEHPLNETFGSITDNDFDLDGTTYTVWRVTVDTGPTFLDFSVATGDPAAAQFPSAILGELTLKITANQGNADGAGVVTRSLSDVTYDSVNARYASILTENFPMIMSGDIFFVELIRTPTNSPATGAPAITGTAQVGQTLTAGQGSIADDDGLPATFPDDYTFQWIQVDGSDETDISGATSQTYEPVAGDVGKTLKVKVSFTDDVGNDESRTSAATAAVTAAVVTPPPQSPNAVWSATVTAGAASLGLGIGYIAPGEPLTESAGSITDGDFDLDGTTYTVWRLTQATTGSNPFIFRLATGDPPAVTRLPSAIEGELSLKITLPHLMESQTVPLSDTYDVDIDHYIIQFVNLSNVLNDDAFTAELLRSGGTSTNTAPTVANPIPDQTATTDTEFTFTVPEDAFADTDTGDTLTYSATLSDASALPSWLTFDTTTRTFMGTPTTAGTLTVRVTATDGSDASIHDDFDIVVTTAVVTPPPQSPNAVWSATVTVAESTNADGYGYIAEAHPVSADELGSITDDDFDLDGTNYTVWRVSRASAGTGVFRFTVATGDPPAVAPLPSTLLNDLSLKITANEGHEDGPDILTLNLSDGTYNDSTSNAAIFGYEFSFTDAHFNPDITTGSYRVELIRSGGTSTNTAPTVANPIGDQTATADTEFTFTVPEDAFADTDTGDTLTYSATLSDASALPSWLTFDTTTRTFTGTPTTAGTITVRVTATDGSDASIHDDFDIAVSEAFVCTAPELTGRDVHWTATLTVAVNPDQQTETGYQNTSTLQFGSLEPATFTIGTSPFQAQVLVHQGPAVISLTLDDGLADEQAAVATLHLCDTEFGFSSARLFSEKGTSAYLWDVSGGPLFSVGNEVTVRLSTPTPPSDNAALSALTLANAADDTNIALTPAFDSATTDYDADAGAAARVTVVPTTDDDNATVAYGDDGGNALTDADGDSTNGFQVDIPLIENVIAIIVTAEDGVTTKKYQLTVTRDATATVSGVSVTSTAPRYREAAGANPRDVYGAGDVIEFTVTFSDTVDVDTANGVPRLVFSLGTGAAAVRTNAPYARGSGTSTLVFAYAVQAGDADSDGIFLLDDTDVTGDGGALQLNGGVLSTGSDGAVSTATTFRAAQADHKVDGGRSGPYVESLAVTSTPLILRTGETEADTYGAGETIEFTLTLSEAVTVTGTPHVQFSLGGTATNADYTRGSGSDKLVFAYAVQAADADADGLFVQDGQDVSGSDSAVVVETGESIAATDDSADADLVNPGRGLKSGHRVDGAMSAFDTADPMVLSIVRQDPAVSPTNADSLTWRVTFSEDVANVDPADFTVTGSTATVTGVQAVSGETGVYDVTATGGNLADLDGTVTLGFASTQDIADTADPSNALAATTPTGTDERSWVLDNTAPTVTIEDVPAASGAPFTATFTFSEPVTGFTVGDIAVGNGAASDFTGGDGDTVFTATITPAAAGEVTVDVAADAAEDEAGNGNLAATQAKSTYTAPNTAPTAQDSEVTIEEDGFYTASSSDFTFNDLDGDSLHSVIVTALPAAGKGELRFNHNGILGGSGSEPRTLTAADLPFSQDIYYFDNFGTLTYHPPANANGDAFATYKFRVSDGTDESVAEYTMTIDITPVNDAPTLENPIGNQSATVDASFSFTVPDDAFGDVDGDTLAYSATQGDDTALPSWLTFTAGTRTFQGTPGAGDAGTVTVKVTASDGTLEASGQFDIVVSEAFVCTAPELTGRDVHWTATLTVAANPNNAGQVGYDAAPGGTTFGTLNPTTFTIGSTQFTVGKLIHEGSSFIQIVTGLTAEHVAVAKLHICDTELDFSGAVGLPNNEYLFSITGGPLFSAGNEVTVRISTPTPNSPATGAPAITGVTQAGQTLTAGQGDIADADGLPATFPDDYTFQWIQVDGSDESDIASATSQTYEPVAGDVGKTLKVKVSFQDIAGNDESLTSEATAAVIAAPTTCAMPDFGTRRQIWTGTVTVGQLVVLDVVTDPGFSDLAYGALDDTDFDIGADSYTINRVTVSSAASAASSTSSPGELVFSLTSALTDTAVAALQLHVCDTAYAFSAATYESSAFPSYVWESVPDWSGETTRTLYLSLPANNAPTVANPIGDQTATADTEFTFTVPEDAFADTDTGDTLTYSATLSDASALPSWLTFDVTTRTFTGTPTTAGTITVRVTATDGSDASIHDDFDIVVSEAFVCTVPELTGRDIHWTATLTAAANPNNPTEVGFEGGVRGTISPADFSIGTTDYTVSDLVHQGPANIFFRLSTTSAVLTAEQVAVATLHICDTELAFSSAGEVNARTYIWGSVTGGPLFSADNQVTVRFSTPTPPSDNAALSALTLANAADDTNIALTPAFDSATTDYDADAGAAARVTVVPTTDDDNATVAYGDDGGNALTDADGDSTNGFQVDIPLIENVIAIIVTAEDGVTTKKYQLTVTRDAAATVSGVSVTSTAPRYREAAGANPRDVYGAGDVIEFTVTFSDTVDVDTANGVPRLVFSLGTGAAAVRTNAPYARGSGTSTLVFAYAVQAGDADSDGIFLLDDTDVTGDGGALQLNGGVLSTGSDGAVSTATTFRAAQADHKVDGGRSGPYVESLAVTSTPLILRTGETEADTYGAGETIEFTLTLSEAVTVTGTPHVQFSLGGTATNADYTRGSGSDKLVFAYAVQAADADADGLFVQDGQDVSGSDSAVVVETGESIAATDDSADADLVNPGRGLKSGHRVDGAMSAFDTADPMVLSIVRQDPAVSPTNADSLTWRVTFSEDVANVDNTDFTVSGTTAALAVAEVTAATVHDVTASGGNLADLDGTVTLGFASTQDIADTADPPNALTATTPTGTDERSWVLDNTAPTVTIEDVPAASGAPFTATFTFSEAVTGFTVGDIAVGNGAASDFTGGDGDTVFTATITPAAAGEVTVDVAADAAEDEAGNGNLAATQATSTYAEPNTAPTSADGRLTVTEDEVYSASTTDFTFNDLDGDSLHSVIVTALPAAGKGELRFDHHEVLAETGYQARALTASDLPFSISQEYVDLWGALSYRPPENANGDAFATFGFRVSDGTDESVAEYTMTIDITPVNDAPTSDDETVMTEEDTAYAFKLADFAFADADAGDALDSVTVVTLPGAGKGELKLDGAPVTQNQAFPQTAVVGGQFTYTPPANAHGDAFATFMFKVSDGTDESAAAYTMTVDVTSVEDAPVLATPIANQQAPVGEPFSFTIPAGTFEDGDGDLLNYEATLTDDNLLPAWLMFDDTTLTFEGTPGSGDAGTLTVKVKVSDGDEEASDTFDIVVAAAGTGTACPAPDFGTRRQIWTGNMTVGSVPGSVGGTEYGFSFDGGALDDTTFTIGTRVRNIFALTHQLGGLSNNQLRFQVLISGGEGLSDVAVAALRLHVCNTAYDFSNAVPGTGNSIFLWNASLDWSGESTRTLYLSLPANRAATGGPGVSSDGAAVSGDTLTADPAGIADPDGLPDAFTYQWLREDADGSNPAPIAGETSDTYTLTNDDVGKRVRVRVGFTDQLGSAETLESGPWPSRGAVAEDPANPVRPNTRASGAPTITGPTGGGAPRVGDTLMADIGAVDDADGLPPQAGFGYQWVREDADGSNREDIPGANGPGYTLVPADTGKVVYVRVTFTDGGGGTETVTSAPTEPVAARAAADPANPGGPVSGHPGITGAPRLGATLTADTGAIDEAGGVPASGFRYQWIREDADGTNRRDIPGATGPSYTLTPEDAGKVVHVRVTFTDGGGGTVTVTMGPAEPVSSRPSGPGNLAEGRTVRLDFGQGLDPGSVPAPEDFEVRYTHVDDAGREVTRAASVAAVVVSGSTVTLTLYNPLHHRDAPRVGYTPGSTPLRYAGGVEVPGFGDAAVENRTPDTEPPRVRRSEGPTVDGATLRITFSEPLDPGSVPAPEGFSVRFLTSIGSASWTHERVLVERVSVSGRVVTLTLSRAVDSEKGVSLTYGFEGGVPIRDLAGNPTWVGGRFSAANRTVTGSAAGKTLTADGETVTVEFDEALDAGPAPAPGDFRVKRGPMGRTPVETVEVSGSTVRLTVDPGIAHGAEVRLSYVPGDSPLRFGDGRAVAGFGNLPVENRTGAPAPVVWPGAEDGRDAEEPEEPEEREEPAAREPSGPPLTAVLEAEKDEHGGDPTVRESVSLRFSEAPSGLGSTELGDLVTVTGGTLDGVEGSGADFTVRFRPAGVGPVTVRLPSGGACGGSRGICTPDGRALSAPAEVSIQGPIVVSVADAEVREAPGATLDFVVSLSRPVPAGRRLLLVGFGTRDGTAVGGEDYHTLSGRTYIRPGESSTTVSIRVLDDAHDEGAETMTLTLSDPTSGRIGDGTATGTIVNDDPMPRAWAARFGRTVAEQVLEAVEGRMRASRTPGSELTLAGQRIGLGGAESETESESESESESEFGAMADAESEVGKTAEADAEPEVGKNGERWLAEWLEGEADEEDRASWRRGVSDRELLLGSSFGLTMSAGGGLLGGPGGTVSLWGRSSVSRFDGRDGGLGLDGEVVSSLLGGDWALGSGEMTVGLIVGHSRGEGGYRGGSGNGTVTSTLTGLYPWGRRALSDRLTVWGAAGHGQGTLTLTPEGDDGESRAAMRTDLDLSMVAAGVRGVVLAAPPGGGPELAVTADATGVRTATDGVRGLAAAEGDVTRLRLGLEGTWAVRLDNGGVLTPSLAVGVRHDGGDAETGHGADVGGGIAWSDPVRGLSAELRARGLLSHESDGFRERGLSGTLAWEPEAGGRGPRFDLTHTAGGSSSGGVDALLGLRTMEGLASGNDDDLGNRRLEARFGYGFPVLEDRFTWTPEAGISLWDTGRDYTLGWRLVRRSPGRRVSLGSVELSFEARRHEGSGGDAPRHGVGLRLDVRW